MKYEKLLNILDKKISPFGPDSAKSVISYVNENLDRNKIPKSNRGDYVDYISKHLYYVRKIGLVLYREFSLAPSFVKQLHEHDADKFERNKWIAYYKRFYAKKQSDENMDKYWLDHVHKNKHHWNYWVILDDDGETLVEMPRLYVFEMLADWMSVGKSLRDNYDFRIWLRNKKPKIVLHKNTYKFIKSIVGIDIKKELKG